MKKVVIVGASGMIGAIILRECLQSESVHQVVSVVRENTGVNHSKLEETIHDDFTNYSGLESHFSNCDIAFFCIGVYTGQVKDQQFKVITVHMPAAFANVVKEHSPNATLCFLSGAGADQKEKSRMSFARYKGMAENHLISKNFKKLYIFRPAYIYPVQKREEPNFSYSLMRSLYPLLKIIYSRGVITSEQLGKAMVKAGLAGAEKMILENVDIKRFLRLRSVTKPKLGGW